MWKADLRDAGRVLAATDEAGDVIAHGLALAFPGESLARDCVVPQDLLLVGLFVLALAHVGCILRVISRVRAAAPVHLHVVLAIQVRRVKEA